jgi:hypothetical protein
VCGDADNREFGGEEDTDEKATLRADDEYELTSDGERL